MEILTTHKDYKIKFERKQTYLGQSTNQYINKITFFNNIGIKILDINLSNSDIKFILNQLYDFIELNTTYIQIKLYPSNTTGESYTLGIDDKTVSGGVYSLFTLLNNNLNLIKISFYFDIEFLILFIVCLYDFIKTDPDNAYYDPSFIL